MISRPASVDSRGAGAVAVWLVAVLAAACAGDSRPARAEASSLTVGVAASLTDVIGELAGRYGRETGVHVQVNAAASNTLARQIVEGAPIDVFISADAAQMDVAARAGRLAGTPRPLLSNVLVVVVPRDASTTIARAEDLASPAVRRLAMAQPDSVPAGVYGREWLERAGAWTKVQPKVVPLPTVRAALAAVREARADAAIVYATDARTAGEVRVAYAVPAAEAPRIVYPIAVVAGPREEEARRFVASLLSADARTRFEAAGFSVVEER